MQLLVITPPATAADEPRVAGALLAASLATLHLRKPGAPVQELAAYIEAIPQTFHSWLMLHSHHEWCRATACAGPTSRPGDGQRFHLVHVVPQPDRSGPVPPLLQLRVSEPHFR